MTRWKETVKGNRNQRQNTEVNEETTGLCVWACVLPCRFWNHICSPVALVFSLSGYLHTFLLGSFTPLEMTASPVSAYLCVFHLDLKVSLKDFSTWLHCLFKARRALRDLLSHSPLRFGIGGVSALCFAGWMTESGLGLALSLSLLLLYPCAFTGFHILCSYSVYSYIQIHCFHAFINGCY